MFWVLRAVKRWSYRYGYWQGTRALRTPSERLDWNPSPTGLQALRQGVCSVWKHNMLMVFDEPEDELDLIEHPSVSFLCRRCGISFGYCMEHDGITVDGGDQWEQG